MAPGSVQGSIAERAYLGNRGGTSVRPTASDLRLRVSTSPHIACSVGDAVWLEIDPRRAARVPSAE